MGYYTIMLTTLGCFIENKRKEKNYTQLSLEQLLKIKQSNYSAMIHGKRPFPPSYIESLSKFLSFNLNELTFIQEELNDLKILQKHIKLLSSDSIKRLKEYAELLMLGEKS